MGLSALLWLTQSLCVFDSYALGGLPLVYVIFHGIYLFYLIESKFVHLFLCYTNLQLVIASRIIIKLKLKKEHVEILYISKIDNHVCRNILSDLEKIACNVNFVHMKYKYPIYFPSLYDYFSGKVFYSVYLASVDNILMHYVLSRIDFKELYTFDDGTANIVPGSIYYQEPTNSFISRISRTLLNIRYTMDDIKHKSIKHYTIYKGFENIIPRVIHIDLLPDSQESESSSFDINHQECNVLLGTMIADVIPNKANLPLFIAKCEALLNGLSGNIIFIPHPRSKDKYFAHNDSWEVLSPTSIAELEIVNLLYKYKIVNVYGFLSSCQLNLQTSSRINNYVLFSEKQAEIYKDAVQKLCFSNSNNLRVINLDEQ